MANRIMPLSACFCLVANSVLAQGILKEVNVEAPTRLDWQFAASGFGPAAGKLPRDYDSTQQRYQLFVPKNYARAKAWPLVVFISGGPFAVDKNRQ